jgi:dTDP-glucose 4,6-dehydratase
MKTYLVTGACGFIGSNYCHHVLENRPDARVVAVDNLGFASNEANLDQIRDSLTLEVGDIADYERMREIYQVYKPDYVINFAAESHNDRAINEPSIFMRTNALGAQIMCECSRLEGVETHVHVSTIEVYGELPSFVDAFSEGSPLNAKTPYSAAKAAGDIIVRAYMHTYPGLDVRMTHCANNYGHFQFPEKLIPLMITHVLRGKRVPVYGDGLQMRDWLNVVDHCAAIQAVLEATPIDISIAAATDASLLPIYDVSARNEVTNLEVVRIVLDELGREMHDTVEHVTDRPNHDRHYLIDPKKIETEIGWVPTIQFEQGLRATVQWYLENEAWWQAILERTGDLQVHW